MPQHQGFMSGKKLARVFHDEVVAPLLAELAPGMLYASGLVGPGSDVLGYDTARSMDHDWGPRLTIVLREIDLPRWREPLDAQLRDRLPPTVEGFPTHYWGFPDEALGMAVDGDRHGVQVTSLPELLERHLGIRSTDEIDVPMWLTVTEQQLLELTAGPLFRDDVGEVTPAREALAWYPKDVWRYRMAAAWQRIAQVEPFVGRAGEVDDELGSGLIGASLVRDVMRLSMLQERVYAPYPKWLGTAFRRSTGAAALMPSLDRAQRAESWREREAAIVDAAVILGRRHNGLGLTDPVDPSPRGFHNRPFTVIGAERFARALMDSVTDPSVRAMPAFLGGIDQYMDATDALVSEELRRSLRGWLRERSRRLSPP